jgi:hypothetical protein
MIFQPEIVPCGSNLTTGAEFYYVEYMMWEMYWLDAKAQPQDHPTVFTKAEADAVVTKWIMDR